MWAASITWASKWLGVRAWKSRLFLAPNDIAYRLDVISQGPKKSQFPGPNPLPLGLAMDAARIKTTTTHGAV
jgi:hypothetical protein